MKNLKNVLMVLAGVSFIVFVLGGLSYAQPKIPKEKIPSDIPSYVRKRIEMLYSADPIDRGYGAINLGCMGRKAADAIPFLIAILGDNTTLQWRPIRPGDAYTSPCCEAAKALAKIGKPSVEPLIVALKKDVDWFVRGKAGGALVKLKDPRAIEPLIAALKDEVHHVRDRAAGALKKITGQDFLEN